jgi:hypothetical protein
LLSIILIQTFYSFGIFCISNLHVNYDKASHCCIIYSSFNIAGLNGTGLVVLNVDCQQPLGWLKGAFYQSLNSAGFDPASYAVRNLSCGSVVLEIEYYLNAEIEQFEALVNEGQLVVWAGEESFVAFAAPPPTTAPTDPGQIYLYY